MINPALYGILAAIFYGTSDFVSRKPSSKIGYYLTNLYVQIISFLWLTAVALIFGLFDSHLISSYPRLLLINVLVGLVSFFAFLFLYRGYSKGIMSVVAPITGSYPIVTVVLSFIFLSVRIPLQKLLGISIVIIGIILGGVRSSELRRMISGRPRLAFKEKRVAQDETSQVLGDGHSVVRQKRLTEGAGSAIISFLFFGLLYFGLTFVTPSFGYIMPVIIMRGSAALASFAFLYPLGNKFQFPPTRTILQLTSMGVMDTLGFLSINYGIFLGVTNVPIVSTLSALTVVVTMVLAVIFYKERMEGIQIIGTILMIFGVLFILYTS